MPKSPKLGKITFSLGLAWIIMGVSVVRATGQNQPEKRFPMTPPNITVAPGIKLCGKGLHAYPQGLAVWNKDAEMLMLVSSLRGLLKGKTLNA